MENVLNYALKQRQREKINRNDMRDNYISSKNHCEFINSQNNGK